MHRAGWSATCFDAATRELVATWHGPVWAGLNQTSAAGEYIGMSATAQMAAGTTDVWEDCQSVVQQWHKAMRQQLMPQRMLDTLDRYERQKSTPDSTS